MLSEQIMVSSGALFVRAEEGAAAAGFIFNVLMVARAPLLLFQAVAASLLPHLTRLRTRGDASGQEAFRMSVDTTLLTVAGFATLTTLGVLAVGPEVMQLAFGDKFTYDRARARDRRRRHGVLPLGGGAQPGGARPGPGAASGRLLGRSARSPS